LGLIFCGCGCGGQFEEFLNWRKRKYIYGHSRIGKHYSKETCDKISASRIGKPSPLKGIPMSEENKQKLRGIPKSEESKRKNSESHKGKRKGISLTNNHKLKISIGRKGKCKGIRFSISTEFKPSKLTPLRKAIRNLNKYDEWAAWIKDWDNWTCQYCGIRGGELHSHHIKTVTDIVKENNINTLDEAISCIALWDIGNGITYCKSCHKLLNGGGGLL